MKGLYLRGDIWWIRFTPAHGAAQVQTTTGVRDEAAAIIEARKIMDRARVEVKQEANPCSAEITAYLLAMQRNGLADSTLSSREYVLHKFAAAVAVATPRLITRQAMERWFETRRKTNLHTAVAYLHIVRYWLAWLVDAGRLASNVALSVKIPDKLPMRHRRNFLLPADAKKLLAECDRRPMPAKRADTMKPELRRGTFKDVTLKFAIFCGLHVGLRKQEVIEARPAWLDLDEGLMHVQSTPTFEPKGRDNRTIPLTREFNAWLKSYVKKLPKDAPFLLAPEEKHGKSRYRYDFQKAFKAHAVACGFPGLTFHDLRRTFASLLVSKGVSIYKVAKWLGDTVKVTEETYGHLIPQDAEINKSWD